MVVVLSLLALGMLATGMASMVFGANAALEFGANIVQIERGWTMVIAGSVVASSGAVLLGVALAAQRLGRIARETVQLRDRISHMAELSDERAAVAERAALAATEMVPTPIAPPSHPAGSLEVPLVANVKDNGPTIVGQYASGGNSYVMYSDGSIQADTPAGRRRFESLDSLRAFVAEGGERS